MVVSMPEEPESAIFTVWSSDIEQQNASVVCLCGELDVSTVPLFLTEMRPVVSRQRHVIIDVHLLEYADSTAVAAILSTSKVVRQMGRKFCLSGSHGVVAKILDAILASTEINHFDDVNAALESIARA
jgi:anti-anti-sigma factor